MDRCQSPHRTINLREKVGLREISFHFSGQMEAVMGISEGYYPWCVLPSVMGICSGHHPWYVLSSVMGISAGHRPWCVLPNVMGISAGHHPWCLLPSVMGTSVGHHPWLWCPGLWASLQDTIPDVSCPVLMASLQATTSGVCCLVSWTPSLVCLSWERQSSLGLFFRQSQTTKPERTKGNSESNSKCKNTDSHPTPF